MSKALFYTYVNQNQKFKIRWISIISSNYEGHFDLICQHQQFNHLKQTFKELLNTVTIIFN